MNKKKIQHFAEKHIVPNLQGFRTEGRLVYQVPVKNILRAILFDASGFSSDRFYPQVFVQPLYVPSEHLILGFGKRFLGNWNFSAEPETILAQRLLNHIHDTAMPVLQRCSGEEGLIQEMKEKARSRSLSYYEQQTLAYSLLMVGRNDEGLDELDRLLSMTAKDDRQWARAVHSEIAVLRETLMRDPQETRARLEEWTEQTRAKLGLPR